MKKVVIDAGHGGTDKGEKRGEYNEANITLTSIFNNSLTSSIMKISRLLFSAVMILP